jgi:hypothetical protein
MSLNEQFAQQQGAFKKQSPTASGELITGVSVPVSIDRNGAKLRMQVQLNPSVLDNPQSLNAVLDLLEQSFDLDVWQPSSGGNSGNGFKRGNSGGYNNGGNGYRRY